MPTPTMPNKYSLEHHIKGEPRIEVLTEQVIGKEHLVYNQASGKVHNLDETCALVFRACDGKTPQAEVAARLGVEGEKLLLLSLQTLADAKLIVWSEPQTMDRRELLGSLAKALVIVPVLSTVLMPQPASAMSCVTSAQCRDTPIPAGGGGASGLGPDGCVPCTINCATRSCMQGYRCRDGAGNLINCGPAAAGVDICSAGTMDTLSGPSDCNGGVANANQNCALARAGGVGVNMYFCCSC